MSGSTIVVTPSAAASAYQRASDASGAGGDAFGTTLQRALGDAVSAGEDADAQATDAVANGGDLTHVVTAVSKAQLALQEVVAIRDKVVSAYQEVMRMSI